MDLRNKLSSLSVSPQKVLKIVIGLSVVLLSMWLFTLSRFDYTGDTGNKEVFSKADTSDTLALSSGEPETGVTKGSDGDEESSGIFTNALITFSLLITILVLVWFWVDRKGTPESIGPGRHIDSQMLGEGAQLKIVRINEEIWVLGVTTHSVNLLHRYSEEEWKESKAEFGADNNSFARLFRSKL